MEISKTKIGKRSKKKTNSFLVETINSSKKNSAWGSVAVYLSSSSRNLPEVNLAKINNNSKEGDTIVVPGKVLAKGFVDKKIRVCAFKFSEEAIAKLKDKKCEVVSIIEEIKVNPKATGVKILIWMNH